MCSLQATDKYRSQLEELYKFLASHYPPAFRQSFTNVHRRAHRRNVNEAS